MEAEVQPSLTVAGLAEYEGKDISELLSDETITAIGAQVKESYERDKQSREQWEKVAEKSLKSMTRCQEGQEKKNYPWDGASNVDYPLLLQAVMQFNARAYPAIVKADEAVLCKVVGSDEGMPMIGPDGQPMMQFQGMLVVPTSAGPVLATPQGPAPMPEGAQPEPIWQRPPGAKVERAQRVSAYMNNTLFYRMDDWETETDMLLFQMPAIGVGFRKVWFDGVKHQSRFVPAMKLIVHEDAKSLEDAPQITEEIDGIYPFQIKRDMATGKYRRVELDEQDNDPRMLIEQQCYYDMDEDGIDEPYIVTMEEKTGEVLRIMPNFGVGEVKDGFIKRREYYVKYEFMPHPEGKFYNLGLGHLLDQYGEVINTILNQMIDANHAAVAGGGFIASGLRIQGQGQNSSLKFRPGEYKTVSSTGTELRTGIFERTLPSLSPVMFNLLDLILGAAKDIASIKDVLSGEASNQGQVGTTLALIEQGLQVFTAIYKRVYRGLQGEFKMLYKNMSRHGDEETQADYVNLLDDPAANFEQDFNLKDVDIRPVSEPSSVTKMQKMSRAQFLYGTMEQAAAVGGNAEEILRRVYEAADVEDIDTILPEKQPDPMQQMLQSLSVEELQAKIKEIQSSAVENMAQAEAATLNAETKRGELRLKAAGQVQETFERGINTQRDEAA